MSQCTSRRSALCVGAIRCGDRLNEEARRLDGATGLLSFSRADSDLATVQINKQRDGATGPMLNFILKVIELGTDTDGDARHRRRRLSLLRRSDP